MKYKVISDVIKKSYDKSNTSNITNKEGIFSDIKPPSSDVDLEDYRSDRDYAPKISQKPKVYKCMFCKHEISGPINKFCPFCGAPSEFFVSAGEFYNYNIDGLNASEEKDILTTIQLELGAETFYRKAEEFTTSARTKTYYRNARRHEGYHFSEASNIINIDEDDIELKPEFNIELPDNDLDIFKVSLITEETAIKFYQEARVRAESEVLKSIYTALIKAEENHVDIFDYLINDQIFR